MRGQCGQAGKSLVPLLSVLAALALVAAAVAAVLGVQERGKRLAKERELQKALIENEDLQGRLKDVQQSKAKIEQELTGVRTALADSKTQLAKAIETQQTLSKSVEDREKEIGRLTGDLTQARNQAKEASSQLSQMQTDRERMQQQLADLERAKGDLESKVLELSNKPTVELDKVVVGGESEAQWRETSSTGGQVPPSDGQVVVVNREYDFIVMNLGRNHGLSVGQEFQVVRDSQVLGRVKVEKVYEELSAAAILPESQKDSIREGDTVRPL